jgi:hypothetical protein
MGMSTAIKDIRKKALSNLWFFNRYVVGWKDINNPFHKELCRSRQEWDSDLVTLHLVPRGHLKSSCLTIGYAAWRIARDPNTRIAIFNARDATGVRLLRDTRRQFSHNPRMRKIFPELCIQLGRTKPTGLTWTDHAFEVPSRTIIGEASCTFVSFGSSATSQHYDELLFDDMLDKEHVRTKELRDKHEEWFYECFQLRHDPGRSRIRQVGTFWHHDDTYSRQIRKEREALARGASPHLRVFLRPVWSAPGIPLWPERFTPAVIEATRQQLRSTEGSDYVFNCNYLLNPTPAEHAILRSDSIRYCLREDLQEPHANYISVYYRVDGDEGRYDAIVLVSIDPRGRIYLRRAWTGRWTPDSLLKDLTYLTHAYNLDGVYAPTKLLQETLKPAMAAVNDQRYDAIPFEEIDRPDAMRTSRILALEPVMRRGLLYVVDGFERFNDLKEECDQMSSTGSLGHDVLLVCLADFARFAGRPHYPPERSMPAGSWGESFPWPPKGSSRKWRQHNPVDAALEILPD